MGALSWAGVHIGVAFQMVCELVPKIRNRQEGVLRYVETGWDARCIWRRKNNK